MKRVSEMEKVICKLKCGKVALVLTRDGMVIKGKVVISKKNK